MKPVLFLLLLTYIYIYSNTICRRDLYSECNYEHADLDGKYLCCDICAEKSDCRKCVQRTTLPLGSSFC